ncbi:hypothetical protein B0T24DRAFT_417202 [Lasiosphaeria ovina]|uniref:Glucan 1, 4-alpha-glucosidase n=1 Tax=Lasiosphaeria ovina TaxID=92902 RepID=A0AAE0JYH4_9PEZI|nr:hypothetical protein B0T24DRAFT_417202 [Lasiosphaeria ovina]
MDDPWGSPWTTATADKDQKHPPSPSKSDLEPPPRAFFSASSSPRIPAVSGESPWADDADGFGDWAAPDAPLPTQSGWGGGWGGGAPSPNLVLPARDDFAKTSPIAWPGNIALPKPANGAALRQLSPDPWSADFSTQRSSNDGLSTPRLVIDAPQRADAPDEKPKERGRGTDPAWHAEEESGLDGARGANEETSPTFLPTNKDVTFEESTENKASEYVPVRVSVESAAESHGSRSSSPSGNETDHEDERQDSPITSIDEDSRARQQVSRKLSEKVQQLVEKFDGLARAASQEPRPASRSHSTCPSNLDRNYSSDDGGDFGDFEDADEGEQPPVLYSDTAMTPKPQAAEPVPESDNLSTAESTPVSAEHPVELEQVEQAEQVAGRPSPPEFKADLANVEKLFGLAGADSTDGVLGVNGDVSDQIITDSFTEISERKTWYRISRLGSSRKHNAGDEDSYRRVVWPTSSIHQDTLKVVRRWMEEDSIAGRVTLGGGVSKNQKNMFGWDSSAKPIGLDAVYRKKKAHSRKSSLQALQTTGNAAQGIDGPARKVSGPLRSPTQRKSSITEAPVASFGWSTDSPAQQTQTQTQTLPSKLSLQPSRPVMTPLEPPMQSSPALGTLVAIQLPLSISTAKSSVVTKPLPQSQDDDDEWGEMVSSPLESEPVATGFQSLDDVFPSQTYHSAIAPTAIDHTPVEPKAQGEVGVDSKPAAIPAAIPIPTANNPWAAVDLSLFEPVPKAKATPAEPNAPAFLPEPPTTLIIPPLTPATPLPTISPALLSATHSASLSATSGSRLALSESSRESASNQDFIPSTPLPISSPLVVSDSVGADYALGSQHYDDSDIVREIIASLPDLSYMLR